MTMSAILSADDLNDFISPGVACIKPVETLPPKEPAEENPYEVTKEDKVQPENAPPAQISLTDCLACSGCVTSAEAVLISLQSHTEVLNTLDAYPEIPVGRTSDTNVGQSNGASAGEARVFVASVSPQVRASLAATYGISEKEATHMISQFLSGPQGLRAGGKHGGGFTWIVDTNVLREAVLTLTADEVAESLASNGENGAEKSLPKRPILSSACPGWICYAEKTHPFILPHLSRLKSPQALAGTFLKSALSKALGVPASKIWHLAVMPCFDKKLEASREELTDASWRPESAPVSEVEAQTPVRDVDCVITSRELLTLASARGISLAALPLKALPQSYTPKFPDDTLNSFLFSKRPQIEQSTETSSSGGYLHHVLKTFQARNPGSDIVTQRGRNADVVEYTLVSPSGESILKAARYYGFRNIQNLVRKLKPVRASRLPGAKTPAAGNRRMPMSRNAAGSAGPEYAYVEVMACPGGCTNGGGQIRIEDARELNDTSTVVSNPEESAVTSSKPSPHEQRAWLARVDEAYYSAESESDSEPAEPSQPVSLTEKQARIHEALGYWSNWIDVPLSKLIYTTYREVESDVGKEKNAPDDTTRVVELAGKIGGGW